jgi:hypothetical protein
MGRLNSNRLAGVAAAEALIVAERTGFARAAAAVFLKRSACCRASR